MRLVRGLATAYAARIAVARAREPLRRQDVRTQVEHHAEFVTLRFNEAQTSVVV
jgi:hypothetical protein